MVHRQLHDVGSFVGQQMDAEWCKEHAFGQRIAHRTLVLSIAVGLRVDVINPIAFSYGYDRVHFSGDTIHVDVTIGDKRDDPKRRDRGFVEEIGVAMNQGGEPVLALTHIHAVDKKEHGP